MSEEQEKKGGFFRRLFRREKTEEEATRTDIPESPAKPIPEPEPVKESEELPKAEIVEPDDADKNTDMVKLKSGLKKTRSGFLGRLDRVLSGNRELDQEMVNHLEEVLVTADIGVQTAYDLLNGVTERIKLRELDDPEKVLLHLKTITTEMLVDVEAPLRIGYGNEPFVVMVVGVNGSGKTTTIAKMAARFTKAGRKVLLVAGDTFRAAAVEQLQIWADRIGCPIVRGKEKADPSSVAFEAMERALKDDTEIVLVDTAGRLHTRVPLMEELKKVKRTLGRKLSSAPHETLLVIDASMGQNAILQTKTFNEAIPVTGIALTKLDGTAKGGVIVGISNELKIPVRYIGIGEKTEDLRDFNAKDFAQALFTPVDVSEQD